MTNSVTYAFIREGTSDEGLIPHLTELLVRAGMLEAFGTARDYSGPVADCLGQLADEEGTVEIVFVHRDTDGPDAKGRRAEIMRAAHALADRLESIVIPVVPIQEMEAWLLLDEEPIRSVVGRPSGKIGLNLPKTKHVEKTASPKEVLISALIQASETTGRRHQEERRRFPERRRTLLERLDIDGKIRQLSSWKALEVDIQTAVEHLLSVEP